MNGFVDLENSDHSSEFLEIDPTGRYGRYNDILGKGASKTVYRAFDEYEGIEVAWNQVKLNDFFRNPEDLERLYREIHLLKTLNHRNIMKFYTSWVDTDNRNINFVTEMFTSGTLRQYRLKHKRVHIRAVKHWCRQILMGLLYLHSHDPPVIHRDLKCDNIFINGNQGEVKIGDLGLAAIRRKSHVARCVGTPEFMAPEVYAEEYNELVDVYSFGMCILEMVTFEYPYSECNHPAQIYKKVISGKKPDALYKVEDPDVRRFVDKCLAMVTRRLSAQELLNDPFLQIDDCASDFLSLDFCKDLDNLGPLLRPPLHDSRNSLANGYCTYVGSGHEHDLDYNLVDCEGNEIDLFTSQEDDDMENVDITIEGRRREDDGIFLRLRISDKEGRIRNIYFPFDIEADTALSVATEMVAELDITDQDVSKIAGMIDGEIAALVPQWKRGLAVEEGNVSFCKNCDSDGSLVDFQPSNGPGAKTVQILQCSRHGCGAVHGRFEEITYQFDGHEQCGTEGPPPDSSKYDGLQYTDIWAQHDRPKFGSQCSIDYYSGNEPEPFEPSTFEGEEGIINLELDDKSSARDSTSFNSSAAAKNYENEIRQELRWLKAKYQMQMRELKDQQLGVASKSSTLNSDIKEQKKVSHLSVLALSNEKDELLFGSFASGKPFLRSPRDAEKKCGSQRARNFETAYGSCSPDDMFTAKSFYTDSLLPQSLHRATSLPVDAIDF